jgi:hypothetical protein
MMDDGYWSGFGSNFSNYELGGPIGELSINEHLVSLISHIRLRCIVDGLRWHL